MSDVLTAREVAALNAAREVLEKVKHVASTDPEESGLAWRHGRLHEAADIAENHIFNVMNTASSFLDSKNAKSGMDAYSADRAARRDRIRGKRL